MKRLLFLFITYFLGKVKKVINNFNRLSYSSYLLLNFIKEINIEVENEKRISRRRNK